MSDAMTCKNGNCQWVGPASECIPAHGGGLLCPRCIEHVSPAAAPAKSSIHVRELILVCKGCGCERTFQCDPPLVGAEAIKRWLDTKATRCHCNATHCDVKFKLEPLN